MTAITEINTPSQFACELVMAEPAAKRAKIEVASLQQLDMQKFSLKLGAKTAKGQAVYPNIGGETIRANLTPDAWLSTPFGLIIVEGMNILLSLVERHQKSLECLKV